jgi:glutamyl-tRNA reductase
MNIVCAGISHRNAAVDIREKFAVGAHELEETLALVRRIDGLAGAVIVSTCNRVEYYAASVCPLRMVDGLRGFLRERTGLGDAPLYTHDSPASVRHLFRVASGLDSMVLGETEVLGQLKRAYEAASGCGATTRHLNRLFQGAFRAAKQVRSETGITRGATSVGAVAVELAGKIFGDLGGRTAMILGAGETSELTARSLVSRGVRTVIVANRTFDRAARLAGEIGGMAVHFDRWQNAFDNVDILICSTAAPHPIVTREKIEPLLAGRDGRPLFIIDLAVPRDAEPDVNELENVYLYDMDSLEQIVRRSLDVRQAEVVRCEKLIDAHVGEFVSWMRHHTSRTP